MNDAVRPRLRELVAAYGPAFLTSPRAGLALLHESFPDCPNEARVLSLALEGGVVSALRAGPGGARRAELAHELADAEPALTADEARWAVESWAVGLSLAAVPDPPAAPTLPLVALTEPDRPPSPPEKPAEGTVRVGVAAGALGGWIVGWVCLFPAMATYEPSRHSPPAARASPPAAGQAPARTGRQGSNHTHTPEDNAVFVFLLYPVSGLVVGGLLGGLTVVYLGVHRRELVGGLVGAVLGGVAGLWFRKFWNLLVADPRQPLLSELARLSLGLNVGVVVGACIGIFQEPIWWTWRLLFPPRDSRQTVEEMVLERELGER